MVTQHFARYPIRLTLAALKIACASHLFVKYIFEVNAAGGPSMLPTFTVTGDWLAIDRTHARNRRKALQVGDLVLFSIPSSPDRDGVKRLIGMPGDYVSLGTPGQKGEEQMIQLPQGHCWVVGDNLTASRDSRMFGPLPLALIKGKVIGRPLPFSERKWIQNGLQPVDEDP